MKEKDYDKYINQNTWFHGTTLKRWNKICEKGILANYNKGLEADFGYGFYLAPKYKQAESYINRMLPYILNKPEDKVPIVIECNLKVNDLIDLNKYKYTRFLHFDLEFAEFVANCRLNPNVLIHDYDFIIGVMSDSNPLKLVVDYKENKISKDDLYNGLLKWNSMEQMSIHNQEICDLITIKKVYNLTEEKEVDVDEYNKRFFRKN